jgi:hypothetical protein
MISWLKKCLILLLYLPCKFNCRSIVYKLCKLNIMLSRKRRIYIIRKEGILIILYKLLIINL